MKFTTSNAPLQNLSAELLAVQCTQKTVDGKKLAVLQRSDGGAELDRLLGGRLGAVIEQEQFTGELGKSRLVFAGDPLRARYVLLVGSGDPSDFTLDTWRRMGACVAQAADRVRAASAAGVFETKPVRGFAAPARAQAFAEGVLLGQYRFEQFKTSAGTNNHPLPPALQQFTAATSAGQSISQGFSLGQILGDAVCYARTLVNLPSNICTPQYLAAEARQLARKGRLTCKVFDPKGLAQLKMRLLLAVGRGGAHPPQLIHLSYTPKGKAHKHVALVGKGVTFDTGGYNLKPGNSMLNMKDDMAGAASVLATMRVISQCQPKVHIDAFIPTSENLVDGTTYKPSDIIESRAGKTVEIVNTDAEGRLLLADALDYAVEHKPDYTIDIATLTGGVRYALGELYTAILGTDQKLIDRLIAAGRTAGEPMWQLPLEKEYLAGFKGGPADLRNCGQSGASTITGALFLSEFVGEAAWAHLDIAESSWNDEIKPLGPKGGTGAPVRTLCEFLLNL